MATPNTLGLDFEQLKVQDSEETDHPISAPQNESTPADVSSQLEQEKFGDSPQSKEKKKPYVNVERVKTGGNQRVEYMFSSKKLSQFIQLSTRRTS